MAGIWERLFRPYRIFKLKKQYVKLHGISMEPAEKALARQMTLLKMKHPGKSDEWYLEKIIYDLQRDRNRRH